MPEAGLTMALPFCFTEFRSHTLIWFFSQLVEESLIDFQGKVAQVMKSIGFAFDDFDFVIHPLQLSGVDRIITVIEDAVSISF